MSPYRNWHRPAWDGPADPPSRVPEKPECLSQEWEGIPQAVPHRCLCEEPADPPSLTGVCVRDPTLPRRTLRPCRKCPDRRSPRGPAVPPPRRFGTHQLAARVQLTVKLRHAQPVHGRLRARLGLRWLKGRGHGRASSAWTRTGDPHLLPTQPQRGGAAPTPALKGPRVTGGDRETGSRCCCHTEILYLLKKLASAPRLRLLPRTRWVRQPPREENRQN